MYVRGEFDTGRATANNDNIELLGQVSGVQSMQVSRKAAVKPFGIRP
jgi:hypothetical protein